MISYTRSLTASAARVEQASPEEFVRLLCENWGSTTVQIYEWLAGNPLVSIYFDVDGKLSEGTADQLDARCRAALAAFFADQPTFDLDADILFATSHGGDKLSIRAYAPDYAMHVADIKKRIKALRLGNKDGGVFDEAVYGIRQKIRAVGAIKSPADPRLLVNLSDREDLHLYVIQDVPAGAVRVEVPQTKRQGTDKSTRVPKRQRAAPQQTAESVESVEVQAVESEEDEDVLLPSGGGTLPDVETLLPLLATAGFADVCVRGRKAPFLKFTADRTRPCACCQQTHDRQNWFATLLTSGQFYVKSYSPRCTGMRLSPAASEEDRAEVERQLTTLETSVTAVCSATRALLVRDKHLIDATLRGSQVDLATVRRGGDSDAFAFRSLAGRGYVAQNIIETLYRVAPDRVNATPVLAGYHEADILRSIMTNPRGADRCYATWFIGHQVSQGVEWRNEPRGGANQLFRHRGFLWQKVQDAEFEALFATLTVPKMEMLHAAVTACSEPFADEAAKKGPLKQIREAVKHLQTAKASRAMLQYARLLLTVPDFEDSLDRARHLLGTPCGVLDLRTGEIVPMAERPRVSMSVRPQWRGLDTPTPDVDAFFRMIFAEDGAMVDYMQALLGAAMTGERLEVYICFVGAGANGKGVTVGWLRHVLGPYYIEADPYIFFGDKSHHNGPTPALAELERKRLAVVDESNPKDELNLAIVKRVTGTDVISCRHLFQDPKQMQVTHTQILLTNNLPKFDVDDQALERRIVVVPFNLRFVKDADYDEANPQLRRADPSLARFLEGDSPSEQLLVWLVKGAARFYAAGHRLPPKPAAVKEAERGYYRDNDLLSQMIEESCDKGNNLCVPTPAFNSLARARGLGHGLKNGMQQRGFAKAQRRIEGKMTDVYLGLGFKPCLT